MPNKNQKPRDQNRLHADLASSIFTSMIERLSKEVSNGVLVTINTIYINTCIHILLCLETWDIHVKSENLQLFKKNN